ncbi:MAG: hypothetical protein ABI647_24955 [Gemmatimonadota bacterium]
MTHSVQLRLLIALIVSVALGAFTTRRSKARLDQWSTDPVLAQKLTVERLRRMASPAAFAGSAIFCVGLIVVLEVAMSLLQGTP